MVMVRHGSLSDEPVRFIDTAGAGFEDARDPVTCSTYNDGEVRLVGQVVSMLRDLGVPAADIGVIAPYSARRCSGCPTSTWRWRW